MAAALSNSLEGPPAAKRKRALREFAMMVGAVIIARASGEDTRRSVLSACRAA